MANPSDLPLLSTIAVGLSAAFICGYIAKRLRLPPLAGYIFAGILIGGYTPGFVADHQSAEQLSEIGIVLLLFGVGLHFSFEDFREVKKIATFGAIARLGIVTAISMLVASGMGWSTGAGILLGLSLSVASTVVLLRTYEDTNLNTTTTGKIALGWLIVEDILMVLALLLIPVLADGTHGQDVAIDTELLITNIGVALAKIVIFALVMLIVGRRLLPWLLTIVMRTGSRELFTLAAISMAVGIAYASTALFGVSLALGAFFAGMMIRESDLNHEVAMRILPFQEAFSVLFFVSVGMLFNPAILWDRPLDILILLMVVIPIKGLVTYAIVRAHRYRPHKSILVAAGLAQIGEFSLILCALGVSTGMLQGHERDMIIATAILSIAVNPFLVTNSKRLVDSYLERPLKKTNEDTPAGGPEPKGPEEELHVASSKQKNKIVLIGCGKVGVTLLLQLESLKDRIVIIEDNREKVKQLQSLGYEAYDGNAIDTTILHAAHLEDASACIITLPDPFSVRRIAEIAKEKNPDIKVVVRSHSDEEKNYFDTQSIDIIINDSDEIAIAIENRLRSSGVL